MQNNSTLCGLPTSQELSYPLAWPTASLNLLARAGVGGWWWGDVMKNNDEDQSAWMQLAAGD